MRVRLMLFSIERARNINRRFIWIGEKLSGVFFKLKYDLGNAGIEIEAEKYLTASFFSALAYFAMFFLLFFGLMFVRDGAVLPQNTLFSLGVGTAFFFVFFMLHVFYPKIMSQKIASSIDNSLLFALKSMYIQVTSGVSLYESMVNVSKSDYGVVSKEFGEVVRDISSGESEPKALEKLALKTKSEHLKKTCWQLLNSIRSGASVQGSLQSIVNVLTREQERAIKNYAAELNMWILMYLLLAAAIPTLGVTFLVILSSMGGASVGPEHIVTIVIGAFVIQVILIGFVKNRVPKVFLH